MRIAMGHKGKIGARATCCGVAGHSALAAGAQRHSSRLRLHRLHRRQQSRMSARGVGMTTTMRLHHATRGAHRRRHGADIVPDRCTVDFEIRNIARDDAVALLDRVMNEAATIAGRHRGAFPQAHIGVEVFNDYPGLATPADAEVVRFVGGLVPSQDLSKVDFGTEGGLFWKRLGVPVVVCGPGSMDQGHKPDEFIALDQLEACDRMMEDWCNAACNSCKERSSQRCVRRCGLRRSTPAARRGSLAATAPWRAVSYETEIPPSASKSSRSRKLIVNRGLSQIA